MDKIRFFSTNKVLIYIKGIKNWSGFEITYNGESEDRYDSNDFDINKSEFEALNSALNHVLNNLKPDERTTIEIRGNNEMIKNIILGKNNAFKMKDQYERFLGLEKQLNVKVNFIWIPDKSNKPADITSPEEIKKSRAILQNLREQCHEYKKRGYHPKV